MAKKTKTSLNELRVLPPLSAEEARRELYNPATKYTPEMGDRVLELMSQGLSKVQTAVQLGIHQDTLTNWCNAYPEFKEKYLAGLQYSEAAWESWFQEQIKSGELTSAVGGAFMKYMSARFKENWRTSEGGSSVQVNIQNNTISNMSPEERRERIAELQERQRLANSVTVDVTE